VTSIEELDRRSAAIAAAYDPDRFGRDAAAAADILRTHLTAAGARSSRVWPGTTPEQLLEEWPDPETGPRAAFTPLLTALVAGSTAQHHPGYVGQQLPAPPPLVGPVAMVAAILNNSAAIIEGAPVAVAMERRVVSWMARKVGYGEAGGGVLTSGGTLGSLTALHAMRQAGTAGGHPSRDGAAGERRYAVFVSEEAHYSHRRACAVLGLGADAAVRVPTDAHFRIDLDALRETHRRTVNEGRHPLGVVGTAGSTATGSHDDLAALADYCREHDLWFHVDAAHGGSALLSARYAERLRGVEQADSVVWDAHKLLFMPSLCTGVLFRDASRLDTLFREEAVYLFSETAAGWEQPAARNFETTKPGMVFPLYLTLRTLGVEFLAECVEYTYDLARAFADEVARHERFELLLAPESDIVCFRRKAPVAERDALQLSIRERVNRDGRFFIMRTVLRGEVWLRIVLMNPLTRLGDLRALLEELLV